MAFYSLLSDSLRHPFRRRCNTTWISPAASRRVAASAIASRCATGLVGLAEEITVTAVLHDPAQRSRSRCKTMSRAMLPRRWRAASPSAQRSSRSTTLKATAPPRKTGHLPSMSDPFSTRARRARGTRVLCFFATRVERLATRAAALCTLDSRRPPAVDTKNVTVYTAYSFLA